MANPFQFDEPGSMFEVPDLLREATGGAGTFGPETQRRINELFEDSNRTLSRTEREILERYRASSNEPPRIAADGERAILRAIGAQSELTQAALGALSSNLQASFLQQAQLAIEERERAEDAFRRLLQETREEDQAEADRRASSLERFLGEALQQVGGAVSDATRELGSALAPQLADLEGVQRDSVRQLQSAIEGQASALRAQEQSATGTILAAVQAAAAPARSILEGLGGTLAGLGSQVLEAAGVLGRAVGDPLGALKDAAGGGLWESLLRILGLDPKAPDEPGSDRIRAVLKAMDPEGFLERQVGGQLEGALPDNVVLRALVQLALVVATAPMLLARLSENPANRLLQEYRLDSPDQLLPPPDAIDAWRRGLTDQAAAVGQIRRAGFSQAQAETMLALRRLIPPTGELLDWWLRGIVPEQGVRSELKALGYQDADVDRWLKGALRPVPLGDAIRFAVREVYSPGERAALQLDADYPAELTAKARQVGLGEAEARDYWAAHWELPSLSQAFEMFHRGIIDERELRTLLRALDYSPAWRDKLIRLSYSPITRVDIRRLYGLGMIDHAGLVRRHLDLGYSPEDAEYLARFVELDRENERAQTQSPYRGLTQSKLMQLVRKGLLDPGTAEAELTARGLGSDAARLLVAEAQQAPKGRSRPAG